MISIGEFQIHVFNDATITVDAGGPFGLIPRALWSHHYPHDQNLMVKMAHHCVLLQAHGKNILMDTGQGVDKLRPGLKRALALEGEGGLLRGLGSLGLGPEDIDFVINTHLHSDHCNGNTRFLDGYGSDVAPVFPNAEYIVQRRELEDASHPNERTRGTYFTYNFESLVATNQMRLLEGNIELLPGITCMVTPGHTPGHMSVRMESNDEYAAFVCDMASFSVHFEKLAWMTAYDVEPLVTLETKRLWQQWALDTNAILIFSHDAYTPIAHYQLVDNKHQIVPVEYS